MKILRHISLVILLLQFCALAKGDTDAIDSLKQLLNAAKKDERRIILMNEIAYEYSDIDEKNSFGYARNALELALKINNMKGIGNSCFILAYLSEFSDPDSAVFYYKKSLEHFAQSNDTKFLSQAYNNLGLIYKDRGEYQQAMEYFLKARSVVTNKEQEGMIYNNMGIVYRRSGSYDQAIEYFLKSLNIREELNDLNGLAITNGNLGNLYLSQKQYPQALEYFEKASSQFHQLNNPLFEAQALQNMGIINTEIKNYEEAVKLFDRALNLFQKVNYESGSAMIYINKARISTETKNYAEVLANNLSAIEILKKVNNKEYLTTAYIEAGKAHLNLKNYDNAHKFILSGLELAKEIGDKQKETDGYEGLYQYYEAQKKYEYAYDYYRIYSQLKDSLFNDERSKRMQAILSKAEIEKREKEKDLLEEKIRSKELENKALVGGAIFLSLFAIYFFNTTQQKKKTNKLLSLQNEEIHLKQQQIISINQSLQKSQDQLFQLNEELQKLNSGLENTVKERTVDLQRSHKELDTFLYQSSHALRRPIVNIMGLVQIARIEPEFSTVPNIYDKIEDTAARMDLMLKKLVMVSEINLSEQTPDFIDFEMLISEAITALGTELMFKKIEIRKNIQVQHCFKSDKGLIMIILQNLMENAINYCDDCDGRKSYIDISINEKNDYLTISILDNGIGIPNELIDQVFDMFHVATTRSKGYGLGLYIVKKTVEKLKGKISIKSRENEYTKITVAIPHNILFASL